MGSLLNRISLNKWLLIAAVPLLWCSLMNRGFFASDEYWTGITRYIPAQTSSIDQLVEPDAVKSPSQLMPFYLLAKLALNLGMTEGFQQYVFLLSVLGVVSTLILLWAFFNFPGDEMDRKIGLLLLGFHFASAIGFTRPMFESLSAPLVAIAGICALNYDQKNLRKYLCWGVIVSSLAFLLRPQAGVIALTFVVMPMWKRQWKDLVLAVGVGIFCFVLAGLLDFVLMGEFHGSLKKVLFYNIKHGAEYGAQPFYYFFPLLFLLGFGFWTVKSLWSSQVRKDILKQRSLLLMLGIFILVHSLFANKFERFLIPILPIVFLLLIPAVREILLAANVSRFRRISFIGINLLIFFATTFFEPQGSIIDLVRFANSRDTLRAYMSYKEAIHWYPEVFLKRPIQLTQTSEILEPIACDQVVVVRSYEVANVLSTHPELTVVKQIYSGPIDWLAYKLNPDHNQRRAPLVLLGCPS